MKSFTKFFMAIGLIFMMLMSTQVSYGAESAAAAYKGKNIDFTINEAAGGDADILARLLGPYIKEYTGATPIFANRRGAGGVEGYVYLYKAAPDGLSLGIGTTLPMILNKVTDAPGAIYEPEKFGYAGSILRVKNVFIVAAKGPYTTVADLKKAKKLVLGATSPQGNLALATMSTIKLLDLDAKVITGTKGPGPLLQDVLSGEIAGTCLPMQLALRGIRDGNYKALFTLTVDKISTLPGVPTIKEFISDYNTNADKRELLSIWDQNLVTSHAIITPPGLSKDKMDFLRGLIPQLKKSEQFRKDIDKIFAFHVEDADLLSGAEAEKMVKEAMSKAGRMKSIFQQLLNDYRL